MHSIVKSFSTVEVSGNSVASNNASLICREEVINQNSIQFGGLLIKPYPWRHPESTVPATNVSPPQNSLGEDSNDDDKQPQTLKHPFAITLLGDWLYWTDWATDSIHAVRKNGTGIPRLIKESGISPMDLQAYSSDRQKPGNFVFACSRSRFSFAF